MVKYHGTPLSGTRQDVARFMAARHVCVPFSAPDDLPAALEFCTSFIADSGAYGIWRRGGKLDEAAYIAWLYTFHRHPRFAWAMIPDVIDGGEEENDAAIARFPADIKGVPIAHMHESPDRWHRLATTHEMVGLGGGRGFEEVNTPQWRRRMAEMMEVMCDSQGRPLCRLHGCRILNPEIFEQLPLASGDSTTAAVNQTAVKRTYPLPTAAQRMAVIADRIEHRNSASHWVRNAPQASFALTHFPHA